jgi:prepilin peptidase CpaA
LPQIVLTILVGATTVASLEVGIATVFADVNGTVMHFNETIRTLVIAFALDKTNEGVWVCALLFGSYAAWLDWRTRRIPNWLTVSGLALGILVNSIFGRWHGAKTSLEGAGFALVILLPLVLLRGLGAGDWKLMGAVGALVGWRPMLFVLLLSFLASGAMAIVQMILMRRVKQTLWNTLVLAKGLATFGLRGNLAEISLDNPTLLKVPFGVAVGAAVVIGFVLTHWTR